MPPEFWTTITPRKLYWEVSQIPAFSYWSHNYNYQNWYLQPTFLYESLKLLRQYGLYGVRLNIFNFEITTGSKTEPQYNWQPLEVALTAAQKANLKVDLCLGPFAYPLWPGLRLPPLLINQLPPEISNNYHQLDDNPAFREFALRHVDQQLERYGHDERIDGFYLSNEWPNQQQVENQEWLKSRSSSQLIKELTTICKQKTTKNIIMNTNYDATQKRKIIATYQPWWEILSNQFTLALDVYPSQEKIRKSLFLWSKRQLLSYSNAIQTLKKAIPVSLIFGELEAQPWGNGQSWFNQLTTSPYTSLSSATSFNLKLIRTYRQYIQGASIQKVTWWGSEYWIIQALLNNLQPLQTMHELSKIHHQLFHH